MAFPSTASNEMVSARINSYNSSTFMSQPSTNRSRSFQSLGPQGDNTQNILSGTFSRRPSTTHSDFNCLPDPLEDEADKLDPGEDQSSDLDVDEEEDGNNLTWFRTSTPPIRYVSFALYMSSDLLLLQTLNRETSASETGSAQATLTAGFQFPTATSVTSQPSQPLNANIVLTNPLVTDPRLMVTPTAEALGVPHAPVAPVSTLILQNHIIFHLLNNADERRNILLRLGCQRR